MPADTLTQINIRVDDTHLAWLKDRTARYFAGSVSAQTRADLLLLRDILTVEARRLPLTVAEASCLAAVVGGDMMHAGLGRLLYAEVYDAFRLAREAGGSVSSYAAQFGVDEEQLLERVAQLGPAGDLAVRDAFSRWWAADDSRNTADGFRSVGLTITD